MAFWRWFDEHFRSLSDGSSTHDPTILDDHRINPATGLPMIGGVGGHDVAGNSYGQSSSTLHRDFGQAGVDHDSWRHTAESSNDDLFRSTIHDQNRDW